MYIFKHFSLNYNLKQRTKQNCFHSLSNLLVMRSAGLNFANSSLQASMKSWVDCLAVISRSSMSFFCAIKLLQYNLFTIQGRFQKNSKCWPREYCGRKGVSQVLPFFLKINFCFIFQTSFKFYSTQIVLKIFFDILQFRTYNWSPL